MQQNNSFQFSLFYISSRIFDNVTAIWNFCVQHFFPAKVAIIKAKNVTIALFSSPPYFLFALSFSFVSVILKLIEPKTPVFLRLFTQMTAILIFR